MSNGVVAVLLSALLAPQASLPDGRIYGVVLTTDGQRLEGYLRWDRNETHWTDFLDGRKEIPWEKLREAEALDAEFRRRRELERSISLPGLRISWEEDDGDPPTSAAAIRFGHLRSLTVVQPNRVALVLRSGQELDLVGASTDIGRAFRGLVVETSSGGEVRLRWRELDRIDFHAAPSEVPGPLERRLHGTLRTRTGLELTGYVAWDLDEAVGSDVLDGRAGGRTHAIPFDSIGAIGRETSRSARVWMKSGAQLVLSGTNDVNSENRGIEISDPELGRAVVPWSEFVSLVFHDPWPEAVQAAAHAGSYAAGPLVGTVETRRGERLHGRVRWDLDEEHTWEVLDGRSDGVEYDIELGKVHTLRKVGSSATLVTLHDGRELTLEGASDVGEDNRGIIVWTTEGRAVFVHWRDFVRATLGS